MARSSARRGDLFITVGGDVGPLRASMKAGQSVLNEFGLAAIDVQKEVSAAFANLAANAPAEAKRLEQSYKATFAEIQRNAKQVLNAPNGAAAVEILNVAGAKQAAEAAEAEAAALRDVANAAAAADKAAKGTNAGVRLLAVSSEAAAQDAERHAVALRDQLGALEMVQGKMASTAVAQTQVAKTSGSARIGMLQLGQQLNDVAVGLSTGQRAGTVFAQQLSQIAFAMQLMSQGAEGGQSKFAKFAAFLTSPWGIALTVAATAMGPLIAKLFEGGDAVDRLIDKMREQAQQARDQATANDVWKHSVEGVTEAINKQADDLDKQRQTEREKIRQNLADAREEGDTAERIRAKLLKTRNEVAGHVDELKKRVQALSGVASEAGAAALLAAQAALGNAEGRLANLNRLIDQKTKDIDKSAANAREFEAKLSALNVEGKLDPVKKATDDLAQAEADLLKKRRDGIITLDEYNRRLEEEKKKLQAVKDAAKDTEKAAVGAFKGSVIAAEGTGPNRLGSSAAGFGQFMPNTWVSYFDKLFPDKATLDRAAKLEFRNVREVASAVIDKATDDYVAVLKSAGQSITAANLYAVHLLGAGDAKKLFAAAPGAQTSSFLSSKVLAGNPFLKGTASQARAAIATRIGDSSGAVSSGAAAIQRELEEQAQKQRRQNDNFAEQMARLDEQLLAARGRMLGSIDAQARFESDQVEADRKSYEISVQKAVNDGRITEAQGKELVERENALAAQRQANIEVQRFIRTQDEIQRNLEQEYGFKIEGLRFQEENARTAKERRAIELQIIDAEYELKKQVLQAALKAATAAQNWDEVARISGQIANLPAQKARDQARAAKGNQSPLDAYRESLPQTLDDINQKLEEIEVRGLKALEDDLVSATTKALGLKGALGDVVGELIRLGVQILESQRLSMQAGQPGILSALFGGHRALGGPVDPFKVYEVGEHGRELFVPTVPGTIIPNSMLSSSVPRSVYRKAANDSGRSDQRRPLVQNWNIRTPDADSFNRSRRQIARDERRRLSLSR